LHLINGFQEICALRAVFQEHIAYLATEHIAKGFTIDIGQNFHSGLLHAVDDFLLIFGDQFALIVAGFFGGT
jgi:hypothetical protein